MPQVGKLHKVLDCEVEYEQEVNRLYVIRSIGCSTTTTQTLFIDGKQLTPVDSTYAPMRATDNNRWGPLDLKDCFLVIPPKYKFKVVGSPGEKVVIDGEVHLYSPGEAVETDLMTRFSNQHLKYLSVAKLSKSLGADVAWKKDQEILIGSVTPPTNEKYTFNHLIGVKFSNMSVTDGAVGVRLKLDGVPLDILGTGAGRKGIDAMAIPWPPTDTTQQQPIMLDKQPIVVEPDHTLEVCAVNTSGADISPPAGTSIVIDAVLVYVKERVK